MTTTTIINACAAAFGVTPADITGKRRHRNITEARHLSAWVMRQYLRMSNAQIAASLDRYSHASAVYGVQNARNLMQVDKQYNRIAQQVLTSLGLNEVAA